MIISEPNSPEVVIEKRRARVDAVLEILKDIHFKHEAEKEELIIKFVNSSMSLHEISQLALEIPQ